MNKEALLNEIEKEAFSEEFKKIADYVDMSEETPTEVKPEEQLNVNRSSVGSTPKGDGFLKGFLGKATNAYDAIKKIPVDYKANKAESKSTLSSLTGSIGNAWKGSPDLRHMAYGTGATLAAAGIGTYLMNRRRKNNNAQVVINN